MKIILEATIEKISTRADNTVTIGLGSQEIDPTNGAALFSLRNKFVKVLISDSNITTLEAELVDNSQVVGVKKKTPSARLRAVLFRVWEKAEGTVEFNDFYENELNKIIEHYKTKLE